MVTIPVAVTVTGAERVRRDTPASKTTFSALSPRTPTESGKVKLGYTISIPPSQVKIDESDNHHLQLQIIAAAKSLTEGLLVNPT